MNAKQPLELKRHLIYSSFTVAGEDDAVKRLATLTACVTVAALMPADAASGRLLDYVGQCVPFAREASGIQIFGDAWTWWEQAAGRYVRSHRPQIGSVIVFARTARLPLGHVAVVSRIVEQRVVMLTHANWSRWHGERGHAEQDVTLYDVSARNDWSSVKVWYRDSDGLGGGIYPVQGFIYGTGHAAAGVTGRHPDDIAAIIDAYVPGTPAH